MQITLYFLRSSTHQYFTIHRFHSNVHGEDDHPEDPRRIWRIYEALKNAGCTNRMVKIPSREATVEELRLIHSENHIESIQKTSGRLKRILRPVYHPGFTEKLLVHPLLSVHLQANILAFLFTFAGSTLLLCALTHTRDVKGRTFGNG